MVNIYKFDLTEIQTKIECATLICDVLNNYKNLNEKF
jgi:hypothetical protein